MACTAARRSCPVTSGPWATCAVLVAKFTVALTPGSLFSRRSIRAAHEAQVIPLTARATVDGPVFPVSGVGVMVILPFLTSGPARPYRRGGRACQPVSAPRRTRWAGGAASSWDGP